MADIDLEKLRADLGAWCDQKIAELTRQVGFDETLEGIEFAVQPQQIAVELSQRLMRVGYWKEGAAIDIPKCTNARVVIGVLDASSDLLTDDEIETDDRLRIYEALLNALLEVPTPVKEKGTAGRRGRKPNPERDKRILEAVESGLYSLDQIGEQFGGITRSAVSKAATRARNRREGR